MDIPESGVVTQASSLHTQEAEAGGLTPVQRQPGLHSNILPQNKQQQKKNPDRSPWKAASTQAESDFHPSPSQFKTHKLFYQVFPSLSLPVLDQQIVFKQCCTDTDFSVNDSQANWTGMEPPCTKQQHRVSIGNVGTVSPCNGTCTQILTHSSTFQRKVSFQFSSEALFSFLSTQKGEYLPSLSNKYKMKS